ncbi:ABC transporter [Bifidobacterium saguini DSM 23967]|uniref:ABC transporter n=3 Tax=Bifidobacterium saguini TaxID=762210 RepID=A0A087D6P8_9BIFI|nr:ABC transporter [Bifidobacterium saguini DSM 23967]QTB91164.1 ATP-binding cassette domain-containing protein [Bifidobacterium saguini]
MAKAIWSAPPTDSFDVSPSASRCEAAPSSEGASTSARKVILTNVGHSFDRTGEDMLFRHLTMTLLPQHVYALTGPSGSGKSTLLSIIAGWVTPVTGSVERVDCGRVCWVLQNPHGVARRSAIDHVALPFIARGERRRDAEMHAMELLEAFGLRALADKPFRDLSGGEAQRLMLARGVASHAGLLLVDEPTAQLDLNTAATVNEHLHNLSMSGAIVVVATHDPRTRDACTDLIDLRDWQSEEEHHEVSAQ